MVLVKTCCCGCTLGQGTVGTGIFSTIEAIVVLVYAALALMTVTQPNQLDEFIRKYLQIGGIGYSVEGILVLIASVLLFFAVKMKNRKLLIPWLVFRGISVPVSIGLNIYFFVTGRREIIGPFRITGCLLLIYLYLVVFSYYRSLAKGGKALTPPSEDDPASNSQPFEDSKHVVSTGQLPPVNPNGYPILQPAVALFPVPQGTPNNVISPFNPVNSYLRQHDPVQIDGQLPSYTPNG